MATWPTITDGVTLLAKSVFDSIKSYVDGLTTLTFSNTGLKVSDTDASNTLTIAPGSNLTADRTLTVTTGDAARTLTLTGNPTLDQDVSTTGSPTFAAVTTTGTVKMGSSFLRNRIINGDMRIDQRNSGSATTGVVNTVAYICDRFYFQNATGATVTIQRSTTAPTGFTHSAYVTVTSAGTPAYGFIQQNVEGFNAASLGMNSASSNVTISFWVRSSLTGTYSVSVQDSAYGCSYNATYSINTANTWEYKSVVIPGYASGTWNTDNTQGMAIRFALVNSSSGTANTWVNSSQNGSTTNVNWFGTSGATFYLTGVQLEEGSVATPFERRLYTSELALCQRYYWQTQQGIYMWGNNVTNGQLYQFVPFPVYMRSTPTISNNWTSSGSTATGSIQSSSVHGMNLQINATIGNNFSATYLSGNTISAEL